MMLIDERMEVETPEGAQLSLSLAGPVTRALAYSIDLAIRLVIFMLLALLLSMLGKIGIGLMMIAGFLLEWFYPTLFEAFRHGQTPGKKAMGIAVLHANGSPLSFNGSLIRNLLRTADFFPALYLTGFLSMLLNRRFQRLGDMAADTLVVHLETHNSAKQDNPAPALAPDWPVSRQDQLALLAFHERRGNFSHARQQELAQLAYPELPPQQALEKLNGVSRYLLEGAQ